MPELEDDAAEALLLEEGMQDEIGEEEEEPSYEVPAPALRPADRDPQDVAARRRALHANDSMFNASGIPAPCNPRPSHFILCSLHGPFTRARDTFPPETSGPSPDPDTLTHAGDQVPAVRHDEPALAVHGPPAAHGRRERVAPPRFCRTLFNHAAPP